MMTPMLAFALAKGSEMGFVSIASSLSQQLAGASRAAAGFATQQALSTSTAITSPRGEEVYAREAGIDTHKFAQAHNGSVVAMAATGLAGGDMLNQTDTTAGGSRGTLNAAGESTAVSIAGVTAAQASTNTKTKLSSLTNEFNNFLNSQESISATSSNGANTTTGSGRTQTIGVNDGDAVTATKSATNTKTDSESWQREEGMQGSTEIGANGNGGGKKDGFFSGLFKAGVSAFSGWREAAGQVIATATGNNAALNKDYTFTDSDVATLMKDKNFVASFQDVLSNSKTAGAAELKSAMDSYTTSAAFSQNLGNDAQSIMVNNYRNLHGASQAEALTFFETAAARGDLDTLAKYAGMQNNQNIDGSGLQAPTNRSYYNRNKVTNDYINNAAEVEAQNRTRQAPVVDANGNPTGQYVNNVGANLANFNAAGRDITGNYLTNAPMVAAKVTGNPAAFDAVQKGLQIGGGAGQIYKFGDTYFESGKTKFDNINQAKQYANLGRTGF